MTFKKQQDRITLEAFTTDNTDTTLLQMALEETSFIQFNMFVKAQDDAGRSMNLVYQGSVKRLAGSPNADFVGAVQMVSNRRDAGVAWTVSTVVNAENIEVHIVGENATNIQWAVSFFMDWVF